MKDNLNYDILVKFNYDGEDYIIYTDNTYDDKGIFNLYGACLDNEGRLIEVDDPDVHVIFDVMMKRYRENLLRGEL